MPTKQKWTEAEKLELWGPGPWVDEAERLEWMRHGLVCLMTRNPLVGSLCGYVGVPPTHPLHGKDRRSVRPLRVHGDVNYAKACDHEAGVCHVVKRGQPDDLWWFGFDCLHGHDLAPAQVRFFGIDIELLLDKRAAAGMAYRDQQYVVEQIELLADQLAIVATKEQKCL